jgi:hypothetical protein
MSVNTRKQLVVILNVPNVNSQAFSTEQKERRKKRK